MWTDFVTDERNARISHVARYLSSSADKTALVEIFLQMISSWSRCNRMQSAVPAKRDTPLQLALSPRNVCCNSDDTFDPLPSSLLLSSRKAKNLTLFSFPVCVAQSLLYAAIVQDLLSTIAWSYCAAHTRHVLHLQKNNPTVPFSHFDRRDCLARNFWKSALRVLLRTMMLEVMWATVLNTEELMISKTNCPNLNPMWFFSDTLRTNNLSYLTAGCDHSFEDIEECSVLFIIEIYFLERIEWKKLDRRRKRQHSIYVKVLHMCIFEVLYFPSYLTDQRI